MDMIVDITGSRRSIDAAGSAMEVGFAEIGKLDRISVLLGSWI